MASPTPERDPSTPPPAPARGRSRRPSARVLEAHHTLRTRTTLREVQPRAGAARPPVPLDDRPPNAPPSPVRHASNSPERAGGSAELREIKELIKSLSNTIAQQSGIIAGQCDLIKSQNNAIESIRNDLAAVKEEQQRLKNQYAELQETIEVLRAQLDVLSVSPPSTQTWASVAVSGGPPRSTPSRTMSAGTSAGTNGGPRNKEHRRQLVLH